MCIVSIRELDISEFVFVVNRFSGQELGKKRCSEVDSIEPVEANIVQNAINPTRVYSNLLDVLFENEEFRFIIDKLNRLAKDNRYLEEKVAYTNLLACLGPRIEASKNVRFKAFFTCFSAVQSGFDFFIRLRLKSVEIPSSVIIKHCDALCIDKQLDIIFLLLSKFMDDIIPKLVFSRRVRICKLIAAALFDMDTFLHQIGVASFSYFFFKHILRRNSFSLLVLSSANICSIGNLSSGLFDVPFTWTYFTCVLINWFQSGQGFEYQHLANSLRCLRSMHSMVDSFVVEYNEWSQCLT